MTANSTLSSLSKLLDCSNSKEDMALKELTLHAKNNLCIDFDSMPDSVRFRIEDMLDVVVPKKSLCHDNCFKLCAKFPELTLHTGYVKAPFIMEHSWCSIEHNNQRFFFDPTDLVCFRGTHFKEHLELCSFQKDELFFFASQLGHTGPFHKAFAMIKNLKNIDFLHEEKTSPVAPQPSKFNLKEKLQNNKQNLPKQSRKMACKSKI